MNLERVRHDFLLPVAILLAGILLAGAIFIVRSHHVMGAAATNPNAVRPVSLDDHIIGSPSAPVKIVEYADIDSSYSKQFQQTMEQIMTEYLAGGKVAWVYRHFPYAEPDGYGELHAEAAECAQSISKPATFYRFIDSLNSAAPGENEFNPNNYDTIVGNLGLSVGSFEQCMNAHTFTGKIATDSTNATQIGASGTPYSVLLIHGNPPVPISGALPYAAMKQVIDQSIAKAK